MLLRGTKPCAQGWGSLPPRLGLGSQPPTFQCLCLQIKPGPPHATIWTDGTEGVRHRSVSHCEDTVRYGGACDGPPLWTSAPHRSWGSTTCAQQALTLDSPGRPSVLHARGERTLTPGLREQGPPWEEAPRAFSLSQDVVIGHGPKGRETTGYPFPVAPHSQCKPLSMGLIWGPPPAADQPGIFYSSANWESPLKILGCLTQTLGCPVPKSSYSI